MQLPQRNDLVGLTAPAALLPTATRNAASHHSIHISCGTVYGDVQRFFAGSRETIRPDLWPFRCLGF